MFLYVSKFRSKSKIIKKLPLFILVLISFYSTIIFSQIKNTALEKWTDTTWQNKKCAVALTYDDALNVHLDNAIPLLDSLGFKATFYVSGLFPSFKNRLKDWKAAALNGHELGNHTLFHPCDGKKAGRAWVKPDYDLNIYSVQRMAKEIEMANFLLEAIDNKTKRTFAYPCGEIMAGGFSYIDEVKKTFIAARGVQEKMQKINEIDLYDIGCFVINGQPGNELIDLVKKSMENNALLVFLFHGVDGEHSLNVSLNDHSMLLHYLKENEKNIWVAPLIEIAEYIKIRRKQK